MGQDSREQEDLVAGEGLGWHIVELSLGLQLGENTFLSSSSVVIADHLFGADLLVCDEDLEIVPVLLGHKQIELNRSLLPHCGAGTYENETIAAVPGLGLPALLKVGESLPQRPPLATGFDQAFQLDETLERHGNGELDTEVAEQGDEGVAEESTVHADLDLYAGQSFAQMADAGEDEVLRSVGIMNVSRAMVKIEDLAGLSDGAEQRVVAPLPFLLAIEADSRTFSIATGADHRAIEIEGQAAKAETSQPLGHELPAHLPQIRHAVRIGRGEQATDSGDIRQAFKAEDPQHHRIVAVVAQIPELSVTKQQMDDKAEHGQGVVISAARAQVAENRTQPLSEVESLEKELKEEEPREGGQLLVFEQQGWGGMGFTSNLISAKLHDERPPWVGVGALTTPFYQLRGRFFHTSYRLLDFTAGDVQRHAVNAVQTPVGRTFPAYRQEAFCNWQVEKARITSCCVVLAKGKDVRRVW